VRIAFFALILCAAARVAGAGKSPSAVDAKGDTALHAAKSAAEVKSLIAAGARLEQRDADGRTPLFTAIAGDRIAVATALIAAGANVDASDANGWTPLFAAHSAAAVKLLIAHKVELDARDGNRLLAIQQAAADGDVAKLTALLDAGVSPDARTTDQDGRPLAIACLHDRVAAAKLLVARKAHVNDDGEGEPPLEAAVESGDPALVTWLAQHGADVKALDAKTPLLAKAASGAVVEVLLRLGATHGLKDAKNGVLLAQADGKHADVVRALIAGGARVDTRDDTYDATPLHHVSWSWEEAAPEIARALIDAGADPEARDDEGMTPLMRAIGTGYGAAHLGVAKLLVPHTSLTDTTTNGFTALHLARTADAVKLLVAAGAAVDALDDEGQTPLHQSAANGAEDAVSALLAAGAKVDVIDRAGMTALHYVLLRSNIRGAAKGAEALAKMLLDAGADPDLAPGPYAEGFVRFPQMSDSYEAFIGGKAPTEFAGTAVVKSLLREAHDRKAKTKAVNK
jgi:cytohesin